MANWETCTLGQSCNAGYTCCVATADVGSGKMTCRNADCSAPTTTTVPDWATCFTGDRCNAGFTCCVATADINTGKKTCRSSGCRQVETNPCENLCLSQWNYCGSTVDYCGTGCKAGPCLTSGLGFEDNQPIGVLGRTSLGCILDQKDRTFGVRLGHSDFLTIDMCTAEALIKGYSYIGLEAGKECYASMTEPVLTKATNCDTPCSGKADEMCGGSWALSAYNISGVSLGGLTTADLSAELSHDNTEMPYASESSSAPVATAPFTAFFVGLSALFLRA